MPSWCSRPSLYRTRLCPKEDIGTFGKGSRILGSQKLAAVPHAPLFSPPVLLQHRGDLGNVHADADGRASFRIEDEQLKVWWKRRWGALLTGPLFEALTCPQRYGM